MAHHRLAIIAPFALTAALGTAVACHVEQGGPAAPAPEEIAHDVELTVDAEDTEALERLAADGDDAPETPEPAALRGELRGQLAQAIGELPEDARRTVLLRRKASLRASSRLSYNLPEAASRRWVFRYIETLGMEMSITMVMAASQTSISIAVRPRFLTAPPLVLPLDSM